VDDDDLFMPTKLERQVRVLDSRPEIGVVYSGYYTINTDGAPLEKVCLLPAGSLLKELARADFITSETPLIRRQCLDRVGVFDEELGWSEDWDLWLRIAKAGFLFDCVQEPLSANRIQPDSKTTQIAKVERGVFVILDKLYADPHLPAEVLALKDRAYAGCHFWLSCRYYAVERWEDAQRSFNRALALWPELRSERVFLAEFDGNAFNVRVSDPVKFVSDVFDHLSLEAEGFRQYRARLLSRAYLELMLRSYRYRYLADAKRQLTEAVTVYPKMLTQPEDFVAALTHYAVSLPTGSASDYVDSVLANLPAEARSLRRTRSRVLGNVNIQCAFHDYFAGHWSASTKRVVAALRYRPSCITNRGLVAIFVKSVLRMLTGNNHVQRSITGALRAESRT
jgi:tetratricopeptide (TPR) repeat protein